MWWHVIQSCAGQLASIMLLATACCTALHRHLLKICEGRNSVPDQAYYPKDNLLPCRPTAAVLTWR